MRGVVLTLLVLAGSASCATSRGPSAAVDSAPGARYVALGDSFTIGTGGPPERSFPARWVARAGCAVELRNPAVNGYTTQDILDRELGEVSRLAPSVVTLAAGANDIVQGSTPEEYRTRVRAILGAIRAAGVGRIVALPQPDWSRSPAAEAFGAPAALAARIVEENGILRDETLAAGGTFVDLFPLMEAQAGAGMLAADGLHPSGDAYDAWAAELSRRGLSPCG